MYQITIIMLYFDNWTNQGLNMTGKQQFPVEVVPGNFIRFVLNSRFNSLMCDLI